MFASINWAMVLAVSLMFVWIALLTGSIGSRGGWLIDDRGLPTNTDYNNVYTAGKFVLQGQPAAAYDWNLHKQSQIALTEDPSSSFFPWPYPPTYLFAAAPLATLPYALSMFAWCAFTTAVFAYALRRITLTPTHFLALMAIPTPWFNAYLGQNGALTAALVGGALLTLPKRPVVAGVLIGLLSYKPHLGALFPVILLAAGYWRAFFAATATVVILIVATLAAFGTSPWLAMPEQLARVMAAMTEPGMPEHLQSAFGLALTLGLPAKSALMLQSMLTLAIAAAAAWTWYRKDISYDLKAAFLAAAVTLASPYQFIYDLPVLIIAQAFLLRHWARNRAITRPQIAVLAAVNAFVLLFWVSSIPLGYFGCLGLFSVIACEGLRGTRTQGQPIAVALEA